MVCHTILWTLADHLPDQAGINIVDFLNQAGIQVGRYISRMRQPETGRRKPDFAGFLQVEGKYACGHLSGHRQPLWLSGRPGGGFENTCPWVVNLHVKDFVVYRASHRLGFTIEGCPAGQGMLDIPWLLRELRSHDRDLNAILEQWTPPERELEGTIAEGRKWAADSVEYLHQLIPD